MAEKNSHTAIGGRGMLSRVERGHDQGTGFGCAGGQCEDSGDIQSTGSLSLTDTVSTWVDSVDRTYFVEQYSTKQCEDAAVGTELSNETTGPEDTTLTASQKSYKDLEDGIASAQRVASAAWDKYRSAEKERHELEQTAKVYKKQLRQAEKERTDLEQIAEKYKRQRDKAVDRLSETIRDKKEAEAESRFWRQKIREIGGKMLELSDKTLKFGYE
ncbi:hypothetical protein K435DRAFT_796311 [Dendrothele bispora CBS 962.96]|uniref:Uncharacterized protein n=1 Tax=Dendrothele bispora (strain CBS 962.96) TaxID=1314807 RepID=A0A4S8M6I3_DENBC|nr:hypothetical protein K435DRAFT_796311 [Dendrothele bispora CBS 962.96]